MLYVVISIKKENNGNSLMKENKIAVINRHYSILCNEHAR